MQKPIIQLYNVFKKFGANQVLRGVSLRILQGQVTTIIGKSGTGKSVLLKHIIGLLHPDAGDILLYGEPISKRNQKTACTMSLSCTKNRGSAGSSLQGRKAIAFFYLRTDSFTSSPHSVGIKRIVGIRLKPM